MEAAGNGKPAMLLSIQRPFNGYPLGQAPPHSARPFLRSTAWQVGDLSQQAGAQEADAKRKQDEAERMMEVGGWLGGGGWAVDSKNECSSANVCRDVSTNKYVGRVLREQGRVLPCRTRRSVLVMGRKRGGKETLLLRGPLLLGGGLRQSFSQSQ